MFLNEYAKYKIGTAVFYDVPNAPEKQSKATSKDVILKPNQQDHMNLLRETPQSTNYGPNV